MLLPYGYHPVSAPPGYKLYYLWAMAGAERKLALHEDPAHKWIHNATLRRDVMGAILSRHRGDPAARASSP